MYVCLYPPSAQSAGQPSDGHSWMLIPAAENTREKTTVAKAIGEVIHVLNLDKRFHK